LSDALSVSAARQRSGAEPVGVMRGTAPAPGLRSLPLIQPERLLSLDAFRGFAIAGMILVNNPGTWDQVYGPLRHSTWNGCSFADLIFPFFLFIVGVAVTLSLANGLRRGESRRQLLIKVLGRTVTMFALGIVLNGFPLFDLSVLRIPGVLQRVALCYAAASIIVLTLDLRGQTITAAALLIGYWAIMKFVPTPGEAGGAWSADANPAAYLDDLLLHGHLLHDGWDPEGLLSTLPAISTTLGGVLTGHWLGSAQTRSVRALGLVVAGTLALLCGIIMSIWLPINKTLWSGSYAVFTTGVGLLLLVVFYWLIDLRGYRRWATPFVVLGTNAIVAYVLSALLEKVLLLWTVSGPNGAPMPVQRYLFETFFLPLAPPVTASFLYACAYVVFWLGIAALLYRQRVVIKI
jgi:predicted acyltransferase